jgi:2-methylisocitrate lyase-like PEP mutase family enzyme
VLYAPGLTDMETVRTVCSAVSRPVNVLAQTSFTVAALSEAGAKRISLGSKLTTCAFGVIEAAAREMQEKGTFEFARAGMPFARIQALFSTQ